jgi:hemoglobin
MEKKHFEAWLKLWKETVDENFSGEIAESAKNKAENIAKLMSFKMETETKLKKITLKITSRNSNLENL